MGRISIDNIDKSLPYEGYIWMSDKENPEVYDNQAVTLPSDGENPFVAEGMLYNKEKGLSYSIKYVDGQYFVQEFLVSESDVTNKDNEVKVFESNRMDGRKLKFLRYWEEVLDKDNYKDKDNPDGLPVLTLTKTVFIGFEK